MRAAWGYIFAPFLIVEANGTAGYQAGQDRVFQLGQGSNIAVTAADVI